MEENQLFNSQTWAAGAGGAQRAAHLIPRTLISYKASSNFPPFFFPPLPFFFSNYHAYRTLEAGEERRKHHRPGCGWCFKEVFWEQGGERVWWVNLCLIQTDSPLVREVKKEKQARGSLFADM